VDFFDFHSYILLLRSGAQSRFQGCIVTDVIGENQNQARIEGVTFVFGQTFVRVDQIGVEVIATVYVWG
jgi:hypothetical protein